MNPQLRSLMWKEWHERKWPLALGATCITVGVIAQITYESVHGSPLVISRFFGLYMLFGLLVAVFLAMGTALGELTQRTIGFSASLPVSLRQQAWVRLGGAVVTLVGPMILGTVAICVALLNGMRSMLISGQGGYAEYSDGLAAYKSVWTIAAIAMASSVELMLILCVFGVRRRSQSHIGFTGAWMAFVWISLQSLPSMLGDYDGRYWCGVVVPQALADEFDQLPHGNSWYRDISLVWLQLAGNLLVLTALAWWFVSRYGTHPITAVRKRTSRLRWRLPAILSRISMRWPSPIAALIWLDLRQALPMCLAGLALACLMTAMAVISDKGFDSRLPLRIAGQLSGANWIVATLWGAVVGSGVFSSELEPKLEQFWRSRPIPPSTWFWVKFLAGLAAVLGVLDLTSIVAGWNSSYGQDPDTMTTAYVACLPLLHALTYSLAVLGTCWLRRPVFAAAAAVLFFVIGSLAMAADPAVAEFEPLKVYNALFHDFIATGDLNLLAHGYPVVYGGIAAIIAIASVAAWQAALRPSPFGRRAKA